MSESESEHETPTVGKLINEEKEAPIQEVVVAKKTFREIGVHEELCQACEQLGWKFPSAIQSESLPHSLAGKDIIGLAETGSGKTGAFVLPMLQRLLVKPQAIFGLVVSPTRELAFQISEQVEALGSIVGVKSVTVVGGIDMMTQAIALARKPHIVVGTPGRLVDHLENTKGFNIRNLKCLVLDEADKLLNMDFEEQLNKIVAAAPRERHTMLFSATQTSKVQKLQRASLRKPVKVEVSSKYQTVETLKQYYLFVPAKHKDCYLAHLLNEYNGNTVIVFVATCSQATRLSMLLRNLGFPAVPLHGQMPMPKRLGALNKFKSKQHNILLATDVASRGLDIPSVDFVVNFDVPANSKDYVHRVGRTARAGRSGQAVTFVSQYDVELYQRIEKLIDMKLPQFQTEEREVLALLERVTEAQRIAALEMKEMEQKKRKGKRAREENGNRPNSGKRKAR